MGGWDGTSSANGIGLPRVAMVSTWVWPRVKSPVPWVRGRTPMRALKGRISLVLRPSGRMPSSTIMTRNSSSSIFLKMVSKSAFLLASRSTSLSLWGWLWDVTCSASQVRLMALRRS